MPTTPSGIHGQLTAEPRRELETLLRRLERGDTGGEGRALLAYQAARALGYCKLFGTGHVEFPEVLPVSVALSAADVALDQFARYARSALELPREWDEEEEPTLRDQLCLQRLHERMDAQAVYIAVVESLEAALEKGEIEDREYDDWVARLSEPLEAYDVCLRSVADFLSTVHEDQTLAVWRAALVEPYRVLMPWWLGPELGEIAERRAAQVDNLLKRFAERVGAEAAVEVSPVLVFARLLLRPVRIAAKGQRTRLSLKWHAPDRRHVALSWFEYPLGDDEALKIVFYDARSGERASDLRGYSVQFAGLVRTINENLECTFPVVELRRQVERGEQLWLRVGPSPGALETWEADADALRTVQEVLEREEEPR